MRRVFFDTSGYIALIDRSDQFHEQAVMLARTIARARLPRVTLNYVLAETYTRTRRKLGHLAALTLGESIQRDAAAGLLSIVYADAALEREAWALFRRYRDQQFSYVDCVCFAWLQMAGQVEVLTFDRHFSWMGFARYQG
jgi:predicted nucleic acid-binding protein